MQSLGVYEDERGLMRCKGRLGMVKLPFNTRFPILITARNHVTRLIIEDAHEAVYHNGVKETLAEVRRKF